MRIRLDPPGPTVLVGAYLLGLAAVTVFSIAVSEPSRPRSFLGWLLVAPLLVLCYLAAEGVGQLFSVRFGGMRWHESFSWARIGFVLLWTLPYAAVPVIVSLLR